MKTVLVLATPGVQLLDVSGPLDVFAEANRQARRSAYRLRGVATRSGPVESSSGVRLLADASTEDGPPRDVHTMLVAGTPDAADASLPADTLEWVRATSRRARRFGSVCSGAFVLAAAGLLDGRRATTHWAVAERLAERYPRVTVDADAFYVRDGRCRTAAGVTAGLDLALAFVEEDLGREVAVRVAAQLVMYFKRPGGQTQFSRDGRAAPAGRSVLQELQRWVIANPAEPHRVPELARRAGLSPRHFARLFRNEIGTTPALWVQSARVTAARHVLELPDASPKEAAKRCGFADLHVMRRAFLRFVGVTPAQYRKRFCCR